MTKEYLEGIGYIRCQVCGGTHPTETIGGMTLIMCSSVPQLALYVNPLFDPFEWVEREAFKKRNTSDTVKQG